MTNLPHRHMQRGFTLVEMVVVVLLLGITTMAIAAGGYFVFRDTENLKSEARTLAGYLENIRTQSAIKGKKYSVEYDMDAQIYFAWLPKEAEEGEVVEADDEGSRVATGYHEMPSTYKVNGDKEFSVWIDRITWPNGEDVDSGKVEVDFTPDGGSHWHFIYLMNKEGEYYTIEINPFTGLAEVFPYEKKPDEPKEFTRLN